MACKGSACLHGRSYTSPQGQAALGVFTYLIKHILKFVLSQRAALDIFHRTQILGHALAILPAHGLHLLLRQLLFHTGIVSQIHLGSDDEAGNTGTVMMNLGEPFFPDVLEGSGRGDAETDQEDIGLRV